MPIQSYPSCPLWVSGRLWNTGRWFFFDEIQTCPNARTAIKFLVEDGRFDYIESGSLLGLHYADVSSYPVGFEHSVNMYPLDFEEFLWAKGVSVKALEAVKETLRTYRPVDDFMHDQLGKHYREYLIVGGMPEVVNTYLDIRCRKPGISNMSRCMR